MSDQIETQGKTVEEAVSEALLQLGARRDEVEVKVIDQPKSGFMGFLGGRQAKVVVRKKRSRGRGRSGQDFRQGEDASYQAHDLSENKPRRGRGSRRRPARGGKGGDGGRQEQPAKAADKQEPRGRDNQRRRPAAEVKGRGRNESQAAGGQAQDGNNQSGNNQRDNNQRGDNQRNEGRGGGTRRGRGRGRSNQNNNQQPEARDQQQPEQSRASGNDQNQNKETGGRPTRRRRGTRGGRGRGRGENASAERQDQTVVAETQETQNVREPVSSRSSETTQEQKRREPMDSKKQQPEATTPEAPAAESTPVEAVSTPAPAPPRKAPPKKRAWGGLGAGRKRRQAEAAAKAKAESGETTPDPAPAPVARTSAPPRFDDRGSYSRGRSEYGSNERSRGRSSGGSYTTSRDDNRDNDVMVIEGVECVKYAARMDAITEEGTSEALETIAGGVLARAGFPCECTVEPGEYLQVKISTDDESAGMLIGRHGQTVDAVEHLVERMASNVAGDRVRMNLDINEYRQRRAEELHERAAAAVARVLETGESVHMESMDARERRLVHMSVADEEGVETFTMIASGGKHVVIAKARDEQDNPSDESGD